MENKYDVIVIGTGCGGAAAGALAAYYGHKTLILEKNSIIGGRAATYEKQGFKMDHGHVLLRCNRGPHGKLLRMVECQDLIPEFSFVPDWGINVIIDGKSINIPPNIKTINKLYFLLKEFLGFKFTISDLIRFLLFNIMILKIPDNVARDLYKVNASTLLNIFTDNKYINTIFNGIATVCLGAGMNQVSAGVIKRLWHSRLWGIGYPVNGEGISSLPNSFLRAAKRYGAQLELSTAVEKIIVENNTVKGVMINERLIEADTVISSVGIAETVITLVGEKFFEKKYTERIKNLKYSHEGFSLKYALDKPITGYTWGGEMPGNFDKITSDMSKGILPERLPWMFVAASNIDPCLAPQGKQVIYVISGGSPQKPGQVDWSIWMDKVKEQVAEFFPDITKHTLFCDESTPDDIARYSGRIYGDAVGVAQTVDQAGELRPSPVSPIKGLYYAGADVGNDQVGTELATDGAIALAPYLKKY